MMSIKKFVVKLVYSYKREIEFIPKNFLIQISHFFTKWLVL